MPFKDSLEGTTHFYGDSCQPPHGSLKEKLEEELDKLVEGLVPSKQAEIRFFMKMAYEEGKKDHECIRHECALYIKHCKENHIPHCSRCFAKCPECNKSLT